MVTWPTSLPAIELSSLKESPPDNLIRSNMDIGVDKIRRRTTSAPRDLSFTLKLNQTQLQTLDDFYVTDTFSGSLSFDYIHPRTGSTVKARFVSPPSYADNQKILFSCSISLEILP